MKTVTLEDINQSDFDAAAKAVESGVRAYNRRLDTRPGTVLRDLLVDPEAAVESVISGQTAEVRATSSLKMMKDAQDAGGEVDQSDVESILSNFNIVPTTGRPSRGIVKVTVSDGTLSYVVPEGSIFSTVDGLRFDAESMVSAVSSDASNSGISRNSELYRGSAGYFFLVPVVAEESGSSGNIQQGTSLTPESSISSFVMAEAYKDFDGGSDSQTLDEVIKSIPSGISIRGFVNKTAAEGMLRAEFDSGDYPIVAVSTVGYGNMAQRRDKHNLFGVGVGGRIDLYVRNFSDLYSVTKTVYGRLDGVTNGGGTYKLTLSPADFPGGCWVKSVADPFATGSSSESDEPESEQVLGSLAFDASRTADTSGTWHDIDVSGNASEAFNTVWQGFDVTVREAAHDSGDGSSSDDWSDIRPFKVTVWCLPQIQALQEYVDRDDVRSVSTDVVVRCPIVCNVSVNASVRYDPKNPVDATVARTRIRSYINGLGFVGRLTRSEVVQILKNLGAVSVDMPTQDMLYGELHDAMGVRHALGGDALDVSAIASAEGMLSADTVVFAAEDRNIQISLVPNN